MLANLFHVSLVGSHFGCSGRFDQRPYFLVQIPGQGLKLLLPQAAFRLQTLPFIRLRQAVSSAAEQFGRSTEEAAVIENLPQRCISLVHPAVFQFSSAQVTLFDFVLSQ